MAAPPKPLPTLQPDRFAVGLFDCCAAPGGCGRCAFPAQSSCVPALCDLACSPSCGACQKGAKSKRVLPLPALVEPSSAFVGLDALLTRALRPRPRICAHQAPTSPSVGRAQSASSPASCLPRAPGAWDRAPLSSFACARSNRPHAALTPRCCARSFAGNCCAAGWAYVGLQIVAGFAAGARAPPTPVPASRTRSHRRFAAPRAQGSLSGCCSTTSTVRISAAWPACRPMASRCGSFNSAPAHGRVACAG